MDKKNIWEYTTEVMNLELEQDTMYLSHQGIWPPYNTSHKDLGVETEIFEGKFMDFRKVVYENFGYDFGIYHPLEVPDENVLTFTVSLNHSYLFFVKPQLTIPDESLMSMKPAE